MIVWITGKPQTHFVNPGFDSPSNGSRQFEESSVEGRVVDLECRVTPGYQGFFTRGCIPEFISCSDSRIIDSNSGVNSIRSSTKLSNHSRTSLSSAIESFSSSFSICLTRLILSNICPFLCRFQVNVSASAKSPSYPCPPLQRCASRCRDRPSKPDE